jgi:hemoglobin
MQNLYEYLGEDKIRALADHFYDAMETLEEAKTIRAMHPDDLSESRDKFYWFLIGWSGGPPLYTSKFGHPRLRMRHLPFAVDSAARDAWMLCMRKALEKVVTEEDVRETLFTTFHRIADHMRNTEDEGQ